MDEDLVLHKLEFEKRFGQIELQVQRIDDALKETQNAVKQLASTVEDIHNLSTSVALLANNMEEMCKTQSQQNERLRRLEEKPSKRWEGIVDKIIFTIVGGLIAFVLVKLGLG